MLEPVDTSARDPILWEPSAEHRERAQLTRYTDWLARAHGRRFADYASLQRWSTEDLDGFWSSIWEYFGVLADGSPTPVLAERRMPGARWFPGVRLNWAEHIFRDRDPATLAVLHVAEDEPLTECDWGSLRALTGRLRGGLLDAGVGRGDRVAALMPNRVETLALLLATASLGAVFSCVAPEMGVASVLERFGQIEPKVLVAVEGYRYNGRAYHLRDTVARVSGSLSSLVRTVRVDGAGWEAFTAREAPLEFERVSFEHPLWILYSSGTTGAPKAIMHGHGGILLEHLKKLHLHVDLGREDRFFWYTTTGWMMWNFLVGGLLTDAAIVLYDGSPKHPDLGALWGVCADTGVTVFGSSAGYLTACMGAALEPHTGRDLSRVRAVGSTGSPLLGTVFDWVYDRLGPDLWLFSSSGGTDVCTSFVGGVPILPVRRGELQARSLGAAVEAFDPAGRAVIDEVGELVLSAPMPSMPVGFWGDHDGSRLRESYFDTYPGVWRHGDWIRITPRGGVIISGRSDATINRGGVRFGSSEIYGSVLSDPDVVDALVVEITRPDGSSWLPLFVVMREGVALDDQVVARLRAGLLRDCSPRHLPDEVIAIDEVPRTLSGKLLEVPVKRILMGADATSVLDPSTLTNPQALDPFLRLATPASATLHPFLSPNPASSRLRVDRPLDGILRITLDEPDRRNALDLPLLEELADTLAHADARCIVIRGCTQAFSAGYDLKGLLGPDFGRRANALVAHPHHRVFNALERCSAPVIAQLSGAVMGGGLELAICCDLRFAAQEATFAVPAGRLGLTYSHTGLQRFVETIGLAATKELFLLGRSLDAARALQLGIVTAIHPSADLEREVCGAAAQIARHSPRATAANKQILESLRAAGRTLPPTLITELEALREASVTSGDLAEGIAAFQARREPHWA